MPRWSLLGCVSCPIEDDEMPMSLKIGRPL
jgi:hypothetical protein